MFKSSAHFYGTAQDDPAFFTEGMGSPHPPATPIERDILDAEAAVNEFAEHNPDTTVTMLRCTNVLGPYVKTSHTALFRLPGGADDPRLRPALPVRARGRRGAALAHALRNDLPGVYNVAADGVLALSEAIGLLGKPYAPILPPWGTGIAVGCCAAPACASRPRCSASCASGAGSTTASSSRPASATATPAARP